MEWPFTCQPAIILRVHWLFHYRIDYIVYNLNIMHPARKLYGIIIVLLFFSTTTASAQEQIENTITLATKSGDTVFSPVLSKAVISIQNNTDFKALIQLFPIVPNPDAEDSLEQHKKPLVLKLTGRFPVQNADFLTTADNGRTYDMDVQAQVNDSVQNMTIHFALTVPRGEPVSPNGNFPGYPARITFTFVLAPKTFGLNTHPFDINNVILVQVADARINKQE